MLTRFVSLIALLSSLVIPSLAHATSWYVATTGSDSNTCTQAQQISTPKLTISAGITCVQETGSGAGHFLRILTGTYNQRISTALQTIPSGTAGNVFTIIAHDGPRTVTLNPSGGVNALTLNGVAISYVTLDGLVLDGINGGDDADGVFLCCGVAFGTDPKPTNIVFQNGTVKRWGGQGVQIFTDQITVRNSLIQDNGIGPATSASHGLYVAGADNLFEDNEVFGNGFYGFHVFHSGSTAVTGNIIRRNKVYGNGIENQPPVTSGGFGIIVSKGANNKVYNNVVYENGLGPANFGGGIQVGDGCDNCEVDNNTVYGNGPSPGIAIDATTSGVKLRNNIIRANGGTSISDNGTGTTKSDNLCQTALTGCSLTSDPLLANPAVDDYRLCTASGVPAAGCTGASPAINAGLDLSGSFTTDFVGTTRPQGAAFDIGAYEAPQPGGAGGTTGPPRRRGVS